MKTHAWALLSVATVSLIAGMAQAQEASVLEGPAAFGDYKADKPGVVRHIRAGDIEAPNMDQSASNGPENVPMPENALPAVKDGFKIELVAQGIENPRAMRFSPNGDLFLSNSDQGQVLIYRFADGAEPEKHVFVEGLNQPYGIAFYPPGDSPEFIYIAESDGLKRYPYKPGDLKAKEGERGPEAEVILQGIPAEGHWTRDVVVGQDGATIYYSIGSDTNVGETMERAPTEGVEAWARAQPLGASWGDEELRAAVHAIDPSGENQRYFATGLRNCSGMALQPATGEPWCVVNERDALGDNLPFEYATSVTEGNFYGWPWYYIGGNEDPRWEGARPDLKDQVTVPDVLFQAHSAPLGITFYDSDAWGAEYKGDAFVTFHGSWNRNTRTGYKVVRLDFDESGKPTGTYEDFVTGFVTDDASVWGRPVGIAVGPDGSLYFSEDGSGTIWRVSKAE